MATRVQKFPKLYKRSSTGKLLVWEINVCENDISTFHGQVDGKIQRSDETITSGKNLGKKNATTPAQQASLEAQARWELKRAKNGYVEDESRAGAGESDAEGGIAPMLAKSFAKDGKKIAFPCAVQPKLDGIRCIATLDEGAARLWTRTRKPIEGLAHVRAALEAAFPTGTHVLDGELYNHALKSDFERIVSAVRGGKDTEDARLVEYHLYDYPSAPDGFDERVRDLAAALDRAAIANQDEPAVDLDPLVFVETENVADEAELMVAFQHFRDEGYEGAMARNLAGEYAEGKRSNDLQKIKEFEDAEFRVVGIEEGRGKLAGHVGAFVCVSPDPKATAPEQFRAKMMGSLDGLRALFEGPESAWKGKLLTVRYQGLTGKNGVPRFPVGVRFREGGL